MIATLSRVLLGFVLACLAAGLALVLHVEPLTQIVNQSGPALNDQLLSLGELALKAGTHSAIFAAPFALIAAAIGEWQRARSIWPYLLAGVAIAAGGFMAQHASEAAGQHTVLNEYAARAFGLSGLAAGFVYWLFAGRFAGGRDAEESADGDASGAKPATTATQTAATKPATTATTAASATAPSPAPKPAAAATPAAAAPAAATPAAAAPAAAVKAATPAAPATPAAASTPAAAVAPAGATPATPAGGAAPAAAKPATPPADAGQPAKKP